MLSASWASVALFLAIASLGKAAPTARAAVGLNIALSPSAQVPNDASPPIDPAYAGFAFEERSFPAYVGNGGSPNTFTRNLINAIGQKTRVAPIVRVGGTSCDWSTFYPDQKQEYIIPKSQEGKNIPIGLEIGPSFFSSFSNLADAQYIIDIPLVRNNLSNSIEYAKAAYKSIPKGQQFAWEIGNEPQYYGRFSSSDGPSGYVKNWLDFTNAISKSLGSGSNSRLFEAFTGATPITDLEEGPWTVDNLFEAGLESYSSHIKTVSIHYYQTRAGADLQSSLMDHTVTAARANYFAKPAQYLASKHPDIPLVLAEVGSALASKGQNGTELEAVLGSALWQVDFYLAAMTAGVRRINYQSGTGFWYDMWQPIEYDNMPPHVRAPFYGQAFIADFIGPNVQAQTPTGSYRSSSSGYQLRVSEMSGSRSDFSAYAAHENGKLDRLALINLQLWDSSVDKGARPSTNAVLTMPSGVSKVRVEVLTSTTGGLASAEGSITWAGTAWTYANQGIGKQIKNDTKVYNVDKGKVTIPVDASSAVIAYLEY